MGTQAGAEQMQDYTFRFRNAQSRIEAEFTLHFENDDRAREAAQEFERHSYFPIIEVQSGPLIVHQINRAIPIRKPDEKKAQFA